jgi:hypothetical protein
VLIQKQKIKTKPKINIIEGVIVIQKIPNEKAFRNIRTS